MSWLICLSSWHFFWRKIWQNLNNNYKHHQNNNSAAFQSHFYFKGIICHMCGGGYRLGVTNWVQVYITVFNIQLIFNMLFIYGTMNLVLHDKVHLFCRKNSKPSWRWGTLAEWQLFSSSLSSLSSSLLLVCLEWILVCDSMPFRFIFAHLKWVSIELKSLSGSSFYWLSV